MRHMRIGPMLSVAVMILLASTALEAADPMVRSEGSRSAAPAGQAIEAGPVDTPVKILGVQVFIDPKTGLIRAPSPEEAAALAAEMQRQFGSRTAPQTKALSQPVVLANGTVMEQLDPSLMNVSVARVLPDGTVSFDCVKGHAHDLEGAEHSHAGAGTE